MTPVATRHRLTPALPPLPRASGIHNHVGRALRGGVVRRLETRCNAPRLHPTPTLEDRCQGLGQNGSAHFKASAVSASVVSSGRRHRLALPHRGHGP